MFSKFEENNHFWEMFHFKSWFQSRQKFPPETQGGGRKRKSELINKHFQTDSPHPPTIIWLVFKIVRYLIDANSLSKILALVL